MFVTSKVVSFFELAKLLPKNLNKLNVGSDSSDNVGFTISSAGISLTPRKPQVLTNIEEWTTAFNTYMIIIVQKFPNRASELLQYMEIIRHAAKAHGGLGWCIYTTTNFATKPPRLEHYRGPTLI